MSALRAGLLAIGLALMSGVSALSQEADAQAVLDNDLIWPRIGWWPGGLSGLVMDPDGDAFWALSDRGRLVRGTILRDGAGRLKSIAHIDTVPLLPPEDADWPDNAYHRDSEGLALMPDGLLAVSYEGLHRVSLHSTNGVFQRWIPIPDELRSLPVNNGPEAVAADTDGTIYTLPEGWPSDPSRLPILAYDGNWRIASWLGRTAGYDPVGLDLDDQGRFYLLERRLALPRGFATRIRRFEISEDSTIANEAVLLETAAGTYGNLEGLSVWRDEAGELMASLIADNNFNPFLPRGMVEYRLPE